MRIIVSTVLACLLSACASQQHVQLYPGSELPSGQVLTVEVPAALEIVDLNGQEVPTSSLFSGNTRILKLQPGQYRLNAFYKNVYDIGGGISSEVVRSRSAAFLIDGRAGETWRLGYSAPTNLEQARELKNTFSGWTENVATGERIASEAGSTPQSPLNQLLGSGATASPASAVAPLGSQRPVTVAATGPTAAMSTPTANPPLLPHSDATLATLQQLWRMLTPESREAFMDWTGQ